MTTPFDGKIGLWHWKGDSIAEETIQDVVNTLKMQATAVKQVWVKTSDGTSWQGTWDTDRDLAVDGIASIRKWVQVLESNGLEFHAWAVPKGRDINAEADLIIQVCQVPGVRSMILDIEPYQYFWEGGRDAIRPLMARIRKAVPAGFHIGMAVDPRPQHFISIFPDEWFPFIDSVHLMAYWKSFQRPVDEVLDEAFNTWKVLGRPLYPILQGDADPNEMARARKRSIEVHGARGLSWWRLGVISEAQWPSINVPVSAHSQPTPDAGRFGRQILVTPDDARFVAGTHTGRPASQEFERFTNNKGWTTCHRLAQLKRSQVWARWDPRLPESGWYEISTYIPSKHASTLNARFKIHGIRGRAGELLAPLAQQKYYNQWAPLGVYYFDISNPVAGVVFLTDLTGENNLEVAFDALRWRQVLGITPQTPFLADGFDAPVSVAAERASSAVWPGQWSDATGYAVRYRIGTPQEAYHTGADLNLNAPYYDADAHSPVYAAAHGVVTFAGRLPGWGRVVVIKHDPVISTGQVVYGRYAHIENIRVQVGQRVARGEQIANVGNAEGLYPYHLHFDISHTDILQRVPPHWPGLDLNSLLQNYLDPRQFVQDHRPVEP